MDLSVKPGEEGKILKEVRELLRDLVLPRLADLEVEVQCLRKICWPVCQAIREKSQIDDIKTKKDFIKQTLTTVEEVKFLLIEKQKIHQRLVQLGISTTRTDLIEQELKKIF